MSESTPPVRDELQVYATPTVKAWDLTFNELDHGISSPLTRLAGGPQITDDGFCANGYDSRLSTTITSVGAGASVSLAASVRLTGPLTSATRDTVVALTHATLDQPKLELAVVPDASGLGTSLALRSYNGSVQRWYLGRPMWRYEFRFPELINGLNPSPQGLTFTTNGALLLAAHQGDTKTVIYQVDPDTGEYTGRASSTEYIHMNSLHRRPSNGEIWGNARITSLGQGRMVRLDLPTSFSTGEVTVDAMWDLGFAGSINFVTVGGVEYVLSQQYATTGTVHLYVYLASQMSATVTQADRVKRFDLGLRIQDIAISPTDGLLYASRNAKQGSSTLQGWIQSYDIADAITNLADGATLTPIADYPHASMLAEGIEFEPDTGFLFGSTEGLLTVGDQRSHCAVWSCVIPQVSEYNIYLFDYNGNTHVLEARINGRLALSVSHTPTVNPTKLSIGAPPGAVAGLANGFMSAGTVQQVLLKDEFFTEEELEENYSVGFLNAWPLAVVNPDGESGLTGWTDELTGTTTTRTAGPAPFGGSGYFAGGNSLNSRCRQRITLPTEAAGDRWVRLTWQQSSWDGSSDPGGMGIRCLDASGTQLSLLLGPELSIVPSLTWRQRSFSAALPAGTTQIDILQHRTRTVGANVDCYIDAIEATLYATEEV